MSDSFYHKKLLIVRKPIYRHRLAGFKVMPCVISDFTFREWQELFAQITQKPFAEEWSYQRPDPKDRNQLVEIIVRLYDPKDEDKMFELVEGMQPKIPKEQEPPKLVRPIIKRKRPTKFIVRDDVNEKHFRPMPEGYDYYRGVLMRKDDPNFGAP